MNGAEPDPVIAAGRGDAARGRRASPRLPWSGAMVDEDLLDVAPGQGRVR
jgi:hypothetical protein